MQSLPKIIIHGGAGNIEGSHVDARAYHRALQRTVKEAYVLLVQSNARAAVLHAVRCLEDNPIFNAGTGSKLQRDGQIRMSAAIMSSNTQRFSGVMNVQFVKNPIAVANSLALARNSVLVGDEATRYARQKKFGYHNPQTKHRMKEYIEKLKGETGTVGAVALDARGTICSATSTGGVGYEIPGRVGDSATVAGTYATKFAGVSCTGRGEHIVNHAVAAKITTLVEDGKPLDETVAKLVHRAKVLKQRIGLIALDHKGNMVVGNAHEVQVLYAQHDGRKVTTFFKP